MSCRFERTPAYAKTPQLLGAQGRRFEGGPSVFGIEWFDKAASRVFPEMHRDGTGDERSRMFRPSALYRWHGVLGRSLRALYRLPHSARRCGHINAVDAEWAERINDRINDDRRSPDGAGFADALDANRIGLAANFF